MKIVLLVFTTMNGRLYLVLRYLFGVCDIYKKIILNYRKVLATLEETRTDAVDMRTNIKQTTEEYGKAKVHTDELLELLTAKATLLEKLKAKFGKSEALSDYLGLSDLTVETTEDDALLLDSKFYFF